MTEISKSVLKRKVSLELLKEFKKGKNCLFCGSYTKKLLLHHPIPRYDEENNIATMIVKGKEIEEIEKEMKQCQILCHACHQKIHGFLRRVKASRDNGWGKIDTSDPLIVSLMREYNTIKTRLPKIEKEITEKLEEMKSE